MTPKAEMRVLVGLVLQPFVAFATAFVAAPVFISSDAAGPLGIGAAFAAFFVVIFGALPAIAWLSRRGPLTLGKALIAGALLGNSPAVVILFLAAITNNLRIPAGQSVLAALPMPTFAFGAFVGMSGALVFWLIARDAEPRTSTLAPPPTA